MCPIKRRKRVIRQLNAAIAELKEAKQFVKRRKFEAAEAEIGDSLQFTGKALRSIHPRAPR